MEIDLSTARIPDEFFWEIVKHDGPKKWKWDPSQLMLQCSKAQLGKKGTGPTMLLKYLERLPKGQILANAALLDWLLDDPERIPQEWAKEEKGRVICYFFWGTLFEDPDSGVQFVKCLYWDEKHNRWDWDAYALSETRWYFNDPAIIMAGFLYWTILNYCGIYRL